MIGAIVISVPAASGPMLGYVLTAVTRGLRGPGHHSVVGQLQRRVQFGRRCGNQAPRSGSRSRPLLGSDAREAHPLPGAPHVRRPRIRGQGEAWVGVRDQVAAGTLRPSNKGMARLLLMPVNTASYRPLERLGRD